MRGGARIWLGLYPLTWIEESLSLQLPLARTPAYSGHGGVCLTARGLRQPSVRRVIMRDLFVLGRAALAPNVQTVGADALTRISITSNSTWRLPATNWSQDR